jgi:hypothetical protein
MLELGVGVMQLKTRQLTISELNTIVKMFVVEATFMSF